MHCDTPIREQMKAACVPEAEQVKMAAAMEANPQLNFMDLLALWNEYKGDVPRFWQFLNDAWRVLRGSSPAAPAPAPNDPFAG